MKFAKKFSCLLLCASLLAASVCSVTVRAAEVSAAGQATATNDPALPAAYYEPIQTDAIAGWPKGPAIYAESGILVELGTQKILYAKNADKQLYPASITKILTTLLSIEACSADEQVTFSQHALDSIPWDSSNIGCLRGEVLTMEQCWYAMMLASANEVCCGVAEHVSGSIEAFVERMNQKAASLGCTGTHFANPNGLPDANHYTTAHDMALIADAAFQNETFRRVFSTTRYQIPPTPQYQEIRYLTNHHKMMLSDTEYYYEGCIGGKTGYTLEALNTLVTFAERDGKTLLCVTMRTEGRQVYTDTASLLDYGFTQSFPTEGASFLSAFPTAAPTAEPTPSITAAPSPTAAPSEEPVRPTSVQTVHTTAWYVSLSLVIIGFGLLFLSLWLAYLRRKQKNNRKG